MMTEEELKKLRAVAEGATQSDWYANLIKRGTLWWVSCDEGDSIANMYSRHRDSTGKLSFHSFGNHEENAAHIATFDPPQVTALLDEVERLSAEFGRIKADLRTYMDIANEYAAENARLREALGNQAVIDIARERQRQISKEGWSPEEDHAYVDNQLSRAAAAYALTTGDHAYDVGYGKGNWPWSDLLWKLTNRRRDLEKAGALIVAEIERIDRAAKELEADNG